MKATEVAFTNTPRQRKKKNKQTISQPTITTQPINHQVADDNRHENGFPQRGNIQETDWESNHSEDDTQQFQENFQEQKQNERELFKEKIKYQRRALFRKNAALQMRQVGTNICQVITPVIGLLILVILREIGSSNMKFIQTFELYLPIPFLFNIPYKPFSTIGPYFNITDCHQWYLYQFAEEADETTKAFWGENKGFPMTKPKSHGMIDGNVNILEYPCKEINRSVPYFEDLELQSKNMTVNQYLMSTIAKLHEQKINLGLADYEVEYNEELPDGAFTVEEASTKGLKYILQINDNRYYQYHRNNGITKIGVSSKNPGCGESEPTQLIRTIEGQISVADMINQAYIRELFNDTFIVSGIQIMPYKPKVDLEIERIVNLLGLAVFPTCLCLSLPVFLYNLVIEKETKLVEIMKINGMKMYNYWFVNFLFNFVIYFITAGGYWLVGGFVMQLTFFKSTYWPLMLTVYFGWGICQISMAFFFSVFLNSSQTASIIGYTLSIWACTIASCMNITIYTFPKWMDWYWYLYPAFPFCRTMHQMAVACAYGQCYESFEDLSDEGYQCLLSIYINAVIYLVLALYLYQVIPQTYGVAKHPLFFLKTKGGKKNWFQRMIFGHSKKQSLQVDKIDLSAEDQDSKGERQLVHKLDPKTYFKYPLVVKDLRKIYPGMNGRPPKVANKSICLKINRSELFGLLGPNGAGKTTLISMLTGMYKPTEGNAWIAGYDIRNQLELVQLQIGVCPQFDILWNDLTVEEHLLFYARLKGVAPSDELGMVNKALKEVQLVNERDQPTRSLPLGMKRRLSIAISLVADPKIVFLDEPTTGLDPETRRQLWNILQESRNVHKRAMVLTTHSMEEADVLCNRIGIVNDGVLRCIGTQVRLKTIYGGGYHLFVNCQKNKQLRISLLKKQQAEYRKLGVKVDNINNIDENDILQTDEDLTSSDNMQSKTFTTLADIDENEEPFSEEAVHQNAMEFIARLIPSAILLRDFNGNLVYQIPIEGFNAENLFIEMEKNKERLKIADWGISQCTLEDVFTRICGEH